MLDDFATQRVAFLSGVRDAFCLQIIGQFILLASGVIVAIAIVAADCRTCVHIKQQHCKYSNNEVVSRHLQELLK